MEPIPKQFQDRYTGQVAIVLGNGPSINHYDLSDPFFTNNITLGSNAIGKIFKPTFYCMFDPVVPSVFNKHIKSCYGNSIFLVSRWVLNRMKNRNVLPGISPVHLVNYELRDYVGPPNGKIYNGRTSGCVMTHIAYLMGFKYVFLLGIDGYSGLTNSHFYKSTRDVSFKRELEVYKSDRVACSHLEATLKYFVKNGRYLYNLSSVSTYRMIPKYSLERAENANHVPEQTPQNNTATSEPTVREE